MIKPLKDQSRARPAGKNLVAIDGTLDRVIHLRISVLEKGRNAWREELHMTQRDAVREHIACHNPLCQGGGISLGNILREMVKGHQSDFIGTSFCVGQEGDLEVPETLHSCATRFEIQAFLHFRIS